LASVEAEKSGVHIYCQPAKLALGTQNYKDILDQEIKSLPASPKVNEMTINILLLLGLQETFPCKGK